MSKTIPMSEFVALYGPDTAVVDVREPHEYVAGHIPGAVSMPLAQVTNRRGELPGDQTIYVVCASGNRSKVGADLVAYAGLDAISVNGGTQAWQVIGREVVCGSDPR